MPNFRRGLLVFGAPGSGKSRGFVLPFSMQCVKRRESIFLMDAKSELYGKLADFFRDSGYEVRVFNLLNMDHSDGWNCLAGLEDDPIGVQTVANIIIHNTSGPGEAGDFWSRAEVNLLEALLHYVCLRTPVGSGDLLPINERAIGDVYTFLLNRFQLSRLNGWINDGGEVFVIYTRKALAMEMGVSYHKIIAAMKELVALNLIWEMRCGRGDANQIYLAKMEHTTTAASAPFVEPGDEAARSSDGEFLDDGAVGQESDVPAQEIPLVVASNTDKNYTDEIHTESSQSVLACEAGSARETKKLPQRRPSPSQKRHKGASP